MIKLFVLSDRTDLLAQAPGYNNQDLQIIKVYLHGLPLGKLQSNMLGEGRAILYDLDVADTDYVGLVNARWNDKYHLLQTSLETLGNFLIRSIKPDIVMAPWPTNASWLDYGYDWLSLTASVHPSMMPLINELNHYTGMDLTTGRISFWANDFICRTEVFLQWREHWRSCFNHFHGKYGFLLPYRAENMDIQRMPAYFYERVTTHYFANRDDVEIVQIP